MLLLDQNISYKVAKILRTQFPGIVHLSDVQLLNASDAAIWEYAKQHQLAIVSYDNDFLNLSILRGTPPKLILLKAGNRKTNALAELLSENRESITTFIRDAAYRGIACLTIK